jgi:ornithine decarboxylase
MDFETALKLVDTHGTPTLFLSKSRVRESYKAIKYALPGVEHFYAVKSNAEPQLIKILADMGASFDVCTNGEIDILKKAGVAAKRCLHTHPIKRESDISYALDFGIRLFVVDNEFELDKLIPFKDKARLLVRMSIQNPGCPVNLSQKFGVAPADTFALITKAVSMGLDVAGISFHVGSQNENQLKYIEALDYCRDVCRKAALAGIILDIIDIGGGFPINYLTSVAPIQQFCQPINEYLERYFSNYRIIAEPGRFVSGPSMMLAAKVMGKSMRSGVWWYYLDEGLYGSFSGKMFDHANYPLFTSRTGPTYNSVLAGPTCDSIDVLYENIALPEMQIGDVLLFESMGSYTTASASNFNGFPKAKIVCIS